MMIQPKAATYDRICALPAVLLESTLWKYTCKSADRTCGVLQLRYVAMSGILIISFQEISRTSNIWFCFVKLSNLYCKI